LIPFFQPTRELAETEERNLHRKRRRPHTPDEPVDAVAVEDHELLRSAPNQ